MTIYNGGRGNLKFSILFLLLSILILSLLSTPVSADTKINGVGKFKVTQAIKDFL
jgi:hypothetical protein